jgi:hypothetical protein
MIKWVVDKDRAHFHYLINTDTKKVLGYCYTNDGGALWMMRKVTKAPDITDENDIHYDMYSWTREILGEFRGNLDNAKKRVQELLNIVELGKDGKVEDVMKFLAQLKNVEVFGKIEVVIRIEMPEVKKE